MRTAIDGVDVVGETKNRLRVAVVVLQADLHDDTAALGFHVDGLVVQNLLSAIQVLDKFRNAAVVFELDSFRLAGFGISGAFVSERDEQAFVEEGQLAQALGQGIEVVLRNCENAFVGKKTDLGAGLCFHGAGFLQLAGGLAFGVRLLPGETITPDFQFEFLA